MNIDPVQLYDWLARFGFPGAMALFIYMSYRGVVGWTSVWAAEREAIKAACEARVKDTVSSYDCRLKEMLDAYAVRLREIVEEKDERIAQIIEERNARVAELLEERNDFLGMVIGGQRGLSKALDVISENIEPKKLRPGR